MTTPDNQAALREKIHATVRRNVDLALSFNWNGDQHAAQVEETVDDLIKLISLECNEARIEALKWALNDYNMHDTDTAKNLEDYIAELQAPTTTKEDI